MRFKAIFGSLWAGCVVVSAGLISVASGSAEAHAAGSVETPALALPEKGPIESQESLQDWFPGVDPVPVLNVSGFSACMASQVSEPALFLPEVSELHGLGLADGLLPYLAVYPGVRPATSAEWLQDWAHQKWQVRFEEPESKLADFLDQGEGALAPAEFFSRALSLCSSWEGSGRADLLCAAMLGHNLMRTLGRNDRAVYLDRRTNHWVDLNPEWFKSRREYWLKARERIRARLTPLRADGTEKFGEWYHFFGILAFSVRELAVNGNVDAVENAVRWNRRLNPILAGGFEEPEKARLDVDSVKVAEQLVSQVLLGVPLDPFRTPEGRAYCAAPAAYRLLR